MLKIVAQRLVGAIRQNDIASRIGGDEFVVLLSEIEKTEDIISVAQKIIEAMAEPFELSRGIMAKTGTSIGAAVFPDHSEDFATLLHLADEALYKAKNSGRGKVYIHNFES